MRGNAQPQSDGRCGENSPAASIYCSSSVSWPAQARSWQVSLTCATARSRPSAGIARPSSAPTRCVAPNRARNVRSRTDERYSTSPRQERTSFDFRCCRLVRSSAKPSPDHAAGPLAVGGVHARVHVGVAPPSRAHCSRGCPRDRKASTAPSTCARPPTSTVTLIAIAGRLTSFANFPRGPRLNSPGEFPATACTSCRVRELSARPWALDTNEQTVAVNGSATLMIVLAAPVTIFTEAVSVIRGAPLGQLPGFFTKAAHVRGRRIVVAWRQARKGWHHAFGDSTETRRGNGRATPAGLAGAPRLRDAQQIGSAVQAEMLDSWTRAARRGPTRTGSLN
jgi:hypothetical protein